MFKIALSDSWRDELCGRGEVLLRATRLPRAYAYRPNPEKLDPCWLGVIRDGATPCPLLVRRGTGLLGPEMYSFLSKTWRRFSRSSQKLALTVVEKFRTSRGDIWSSTPSTRMGTGSTLRRKRTANMTLQQTNLSVGLRPPSGVRS